MTKTKEHTLEAPTTGLALNEVLEAVANRMGALLLLCLSPLVGLLFVVCLPFLGFAALATMLFRAVTGRGAAPQEPRTPSES